MTKGFEESLSLFKDKISDCIKSNKSISITTHNDCDGLTSGSIITKALIREGVETTNIMKFYENSIYVTSYSKDLAIPGERIGYVAVHPKCEDRESLMAGLTFCNRVLGFVNAPALIQRAVKNVQGVSVDIDQYQRKRDFLYKELTRIGYSVVKPQGAFYFFPKSPTEDDVEFVNKLAEKRVLVVPGRGFGAPGYFRLSYCVPDSVIQGSIAGFEEVFDNH